MVVIKYRSGLSQNQIEAAKFKLSEDDSKSLTLSIADVHDAESPERVVGQLLRLAVKDDAYGDEELYVELNVTDGTDLVRTLQRMLRQIGSFRPEEPIEDEEE